MVRLAKPRLTRSFVRVTAAGSWSRLLRPGRSAATAAAPERSKKMNGADQRQNRSHIPRVFINDNLALFYGVKIHLVWSATLKHEAAVSMTKWDEK